MRKNKISVMKLLLFGFLLLGFTSLNAQVAVSMPTVNAQMGATGSFSLTSGDLTSQGAYSFEFTLTYDKSIVKITGVEKGTIPTNTPVFTDLTTANTNGSLKVVYAAATPLAGTGSLIKFNYEILAVGTSPLALTGFKFNNGTPAATPTNGSVIVPAISITIGDATGFVGDTLMIPVSTSNLTGYSIYSFNFNYGFDKTKLEVLGHSQVGTLSAGNEALSNPNNTAGTGALAYAAGSTLPAQAGVLVYIKAKVIGAGTSSFTVSNFKYNNGTPAAGVINVGVITTAIIPNFKVEGTVKYRNSSLTPLSNVVVNKDGVLAATTAAPGTYSVTGLLAGTYTFSFSKTGAWGGVLASDALKAALYYVDPVANPLDAVQVMAADVNDDGVVLMSDAQMILNRVVGKISAFTKADWVLSPSSKTLTLSANEVIDVLALATGDVNGSYSPSLAKETVAYTVDEVINVKKSSVFEFPIKVKNASEIGAFTLRLSYPMDKVEFVSASSSVSVISSTEKGIVTLAWADLSTKNSMKVAENGALVVLKFRTSEALNISDIIEVKLESGSELVDRLGKDLSAGLSLSRIANSVPESFELGQNYPNPFNPSTTISYAIPQDGKVNVVVYNAIGQIVATLVNQVQEAGSYKYEWNAGQLTSGIYFYRISVEGAKNFVQTKKMLLLK
ncbi:MAG: hypothetical protein CVV23_11690 [Ignavibacteriae bacterium HGW-Ignavibacteriae-2]|jgi:hypothetical protein|nr:MAG: hypothetical protein CVV23_11690 [Ignavibacteriae bacterium HGW-Ignavibacteriae-2]